MMRSSVLGLLKCVPLPPMKMRKCCTPLPSKPQDVLLSLLRGGVITDVTALLRTGGIKAAIERFALGLMLACLVFFYVSVTRE